MKKILSNATWSILEAICQLVIGFLLGLKTARYLGPDNYGSITYVYSYVAFVITVCGMGFDVVIINHLVKYKNRDGEIIISAIFLKSLVSLIAMFAINLLVQFTDGGDEEIQIIAFISSFQLLFQAFLIIGNWYTYKMQAKIVSLVSLAAYIIGSIYRIWILATGKNVYWFAAYNSVIYATYTVFYACLFFKQCKNSKTPSWKMMKSILIASIPFMISSVFTSIYGQIDKVMIKQILNDTIQVGYYSAVYTLGTLFAFIPNAIFSFTQPILMELKNNNSKNYELRFNQVMASIIWVSILYSIVLTVFSDSIVNVLYGSSYAPAAEVLRYYVWYTVFNNLYNIKNSWLLSSNNSKYSIIFSMFGTIVNIVLNFTLIPSYGLIGVSVSKVIAEIVSTVIAPLFFKDTRIFSIYVIKGLFLHNININGLFKEIKDTLSFEAIKINKCKNRLK